LRRNPFALFLILIVIYEAVSGSFATSPKQWILETIVLLPGIIIGMACHEFAHAFSSDRLGDPTPRAQGRVTLNPLAHIDPVGLIMLLFIHFGWGRPVQIDPRYYRHRRRDELIVALSGVLMNLFLAFVFAGILKLLDLFVLPNIGLAMASIIWQIFFYIIYMNLVLMIFNLLPIPPLDGFNVITQIFNLQRTRFFWRIYDKGSLILLAIILIGSLLNFNIFGFIVSRPAISIVEGLLSLFQLW